jgi:hydrogenase maturation factor HypF (carbamoyltransferase family)
VLSSILDEYSYGDESAFPFAANVELIEEFNADDLLIQLEKVYKAGIALIDKNLSNEIQVELATNLKADLAASVFDALIEQLLLLVVNLAQEINVSNIAFTGRISHVHRAEKILTNEIQRYNMTASFSEDQA